MVIDPIDPDVMCTMAFLLLRTPMFLIVKSPKPLSSLYYKAHLLLPSVRLHLSSHAADEASI